MVRFARSGKNWEGRAWIVNAAVAALADQVEAAWPPRHATDGTVASQSHDAINPGSDHRPYPYTGSGVVYAIDVGEVTEGDGERLAEQLRISRDPRIKYVIHESRVFSSYSNATRAAWQWGKYTAANPHTDHVHVSVWRTAGPGGWAITLKEEEDEMVTRDSKADEGLPALAEVVARAVAAGIATAATQPGGVAFNDEVLAMIERALRPISDRVRRLESSTGGVPHTHPLQGSTGLGG